MSKLNLSGFNPLSRNARRSSSSRATDSQIHVYDAASVSADDEIDDLSPPPKRTFSKSQKLETDEFHFFSQKLKMLRKQNSKRPPLPCQCSKDAGKLTVVLDLDETLIHSEISPRSSLRKASQDTVDSPSCANASGDTFEIKLSDGETVKVFKRPGLNEFLTSMSDKFELMVYTAGLKQYAEPLLDFLDPSGTIFRHRLYRDSCLFTGGYYVKDLAKVNRDLKRTVLVDNNLCCFLPQLNNGIPISSYYKDATDDALTVLKSYIESIDLESDVRATLSSTFNLEKSLGHTRDLLLK